MSESSFTLYAQQIDTERHDRAKRALPKIREQCPGVHVNMVDGYPTVELGEVPREWLTPAREKFLDGNAPWLVSALDGRPSYFPETVEQWKRSGEVEDVHWRYRDALEETVLRVELKDTPEWLGKVLGQFRAKGWSVEIVGE